MAENNLNLNKGYKLANCCQPETSHQIKGYYSYNGIMIVHKSDCANLDKVETDRLVDLKWNDLLAGENQQPDDDYRDLLELDFKILAHHQHYGVDYSLKVARMISADRQEVFDSHNKLRRMNLLSRVKKLIIRYRKGIVDNKWIKHRNHTYYELTKKGHLYLKFYDENKKI